MLVHEYLKTGRVNAIPLNHLAKIMGFASRRELQKQVEAERRAGAVILCDPEGRGYYLSNDPAELRQFIHYMEAKAKNTMASAESARQLLAQIGGEVV